MRPGDVLAKARRRARLTQRELAHRAGVPQSTIGRIETGTIDPRASTLDDLLHFCGEELGARRVLGSGVDRTLIRPLLALTPAERLDVATASARNLDDLIRSRR